MTPGVDVLVIGLTIAGTLLGLMSGGFVLDRAINGKVRRLTDAVTRLEQVLRHLEKDEHAHRQAGLTWARAVHSHLASRDIVIPDPDDFPGL